MTPVPESKTSSECHSRAKENTNDVIMLIAVNLTQSKKYVII